MTSIDIPIQFIEHHIKIPIVNNNNAILGDIPVDVPEFENGIPIGFADQYVPQGHINLDRIFF